MAKELNKKLLFDNVDFLVKGSEMGIGEFEEKTGVSVGFCSRSKKDEKSKPGIDFIMNAADVLGVGIDALLNTDFSALTPTEKYYIKFLSKLERDTREDKLAWNVETREYLTGLDADINGGTEHPLFRYITTMVPGETDYPEPFSRVLFLSKNFGENTVINSDCYDLQLKNGTYLYLMWVCDYGDEYGKVNEAVEVWMHAPGNDPQYICDNRVDGQMATMTNALFASVKENSRHPKVSKPLKAAIDAFMNDDFEDDENEDIPFI